MKQTIERLQKMRSDEYSTFIRVMFGLTSPSPVSNDLDSEGAVEWIDPSLNDSQKDAIRFALASREVALIHGPPGVSSQPLVRLAITDYCLDGKNSYVDRAYITDAQAESPSPGLWTVKYIS